MWDTDEVTRWVNHVEGGCGDGEAGSLLGVARGEQMGTLRGIVVMRKLPHICSPH